MSKFFDDKTSEKVYIETHKGPGGHKNRGGFMRVHIIKLLSFAMKCGCFGVDCCAGYMKIPATDNSTSVYAWIAADTFTIGTKAEADAASLAGAATRPKCEFC